MNLVFGDYEITETIWLPSDRPLDRLYIPLLKRAKTYDRISGYFSDTALISAASGLAHYVANGGVMRLIMGHQIGEDLLAAQGRTLSDELASLIFSDPDDLGTKVFKDHALETLGWMLANDRLLLRICTPRKATGGYFHSKFLLFCDDLGHEVAITGSANESAMGWEANFEQLSVVDDPQGISKLRSEFGRFFADKDPDWQTHNLPDAIAKQLIKVAPRNPPAPLEGMDFTPDPIDLQPSTKEPQTFVGLVIGAAVPLLYHQERAVETITSQWGRSYLIADEVGLGKTIEVGAVLRWGIENGKIQRALILTPASVQEQWQKELEEKLGLLIPRYERGSLLVGDKVVGTPSNPWQSEPFLLASSQLARGAIHQQAILAADPWDLLVIDEAHHARLHDKGRRTKLLALLDAIVNAEKAKVILAASATPIQTDRRELFGIMALLGLRDGWNNQRSFLSFFEQLETFAENPNAVSEEDIRRWHHLVGVYLTDSPSSFDVPFEVSRFLETPVANPAIRTWDDNEREVLLEALRKYSPLGQHFIRETRDRLRSYQREGIAFVGQNIPSRSITDHFIELPIEERRLYDSIDDYIRSRYESYMKNKKTRGLGFLMTVYRRRLTSSFTAVAASLRRRLDRLPVTDADDAREVEGDEELSDSLSQATAGRDAAIQNEDSLIRQFLADIERDVVRDAKTEFLLKELEADQSQFLSVVIFTIYSDTMNWLRDVLLSRFGVLSREFTIGCYSGNGGEIYDPKTSTWELVDKGIIVEELRAGRLKILLGTDAMSEGLNLQWCGKLINFDMPWNLMRVEQRIGRLDRIGATYPTITVSNYFIEDTVEADIHRKLLAKFGDVNQLFAIAPVIASQVEQATAKAVFAPRVDISAITAQIDAPTMPWE